MSHSVRIPTLIIGCLITTYAVRAADCSEAAAKFEEVKQEFHAVAAQMADLDNDCSLSWSKKTYAALKIYDKFVESVKAAQHCGMDTHAPLSAYVEGHNQAVEDYHEKRYKCEMDNKSDLNPDLEDKPKGPDACVGIGVTTTVMCVGPGSSCQCINITNTCQYPISVFYNVDGKERSFSLQGGESSHEACTTEVGQHVEYSRFKPWAGYPHQ